MVDKEGVMEVKINFNDGSTKTFNDVVCYRLFKVPTIVVQKRNGEVHHYPDNETKRVFITADKK